MGGAQPSRRAARTAAARTSEESRPPENETRHGSRRSAGSRAASSASSGVSARGAAVAPTSPSTAGSPAPSTPSASGSRPWGKPAAASSAVRPGGGGVTLGSAVLRLRADNVFWREVDGQVIALDLRSSRYLSTNATATALWPQLAEGAEPAELVQTLVERHRVERERAAADVESFLRWLDDEELLER